MAKKDLNSNNFNPAFRPIKSIEFIESNFDQHYIFQIKLKKMLNKVLLRIFSSHRVTTTTNKPNTKIVNVITCELVKVRETLKCQIKA